MRELTPQEREALYIKHECPFCQSKKFDYGPEGGLSRNIFCTKCGAGYNVYPAELPGGQVIRHPKEGAPKEGWGSPQGIDLNDPYGGED